MLSIWEGVSREERDKGKDRGRNKEKEQEAKCQLENSVQMSVPFAESLILCQRECCYSSPLVNTLPWLLLSGTWRHCLSSFHQQKTFFSVPCNISFIQNLTTFLFCSHNICSIYCPHVYFCPFLPFLFLLKYVQFTIIQTKYMMVSDESYWEI